MTIALTIELRGRKRAPDGLLVLLDLDDTLIVTQARYDRAKKSNSEMVGAELGVAPGVVLAKFSEIDLAAMRAQKSFRVERFAESWVSAYREFDGSDPTTVQRLDATSYGVFKTPYEVYPGTRAALESISQLPGVCVEVLTLGDVAVQKAKVRFLPAAVLAKIDRVLIVDRKDATTFAAVLVGHSPARTVMVGNSMRSDIGPALACDVRAVHIAQGAGWAHDEDPSVDLSDPRLSRVSAIDEVPDALRRLYGRA
jgi:putative hydrolase of the HAD superfamily